MQNIVLSGMRPTGQSLHLGNYFGALVNFLRLQDDPTKDCFFFVANWHAFTTLPDPDEVHANVLNVVADYVAAGLDPAKSVIYVQSMVPETAEIALLLSNSISFGRLTNCTTFKEKSARQEFVSAGLAFYPVLMAADILGVRANLVPVGEDQMQHLEMAREVARHFNRTYAEVFPEPENITMDPIRVPGLDGTSKMGKSEDNAIHLDHSEKEVWERLSVAVTDPARQKRTDQGNPMLCNVYEIAEIMDQAGFHVAIGLPELAARCRSAGQGCIDCKRLVSEAVVRLTAPIRERKMALTRDRDYLCDILRDGAKKARTTVADTLERMREAMGTVF